MAWLNMQHEIGLEGLMLHGVAEYATWKRCWCGLCCMEWTNLQHEIGLKGLMLHGQEKNAT